MSSEENMPEDIAGLFGKFGGNGNGYREFAAPDAEEPRVWPLLSGERIAHPPAAAVQVAAPTPAPASMPAPAPAPASVPVGAAAVQAPAAAPHVAPAPLPVFAPPPGAMFAPEPVTAPAAAGTASAATPLEQLFARLAAPQRPAAPPGPMSRWRRPT